MASKQSAEPGSSVRQPATEASGGSEPWGHEHFGSTQKSIIESIPDAVYVGTEKGITRANQAALDQLGFSSFDELRQDIAILAERIQTRDARTGRVLTAEEQVFARALKGETASMDVLVHHLKTGRDRVLRCSAAPIWVGGRIVAAVCINKDITEERETARLLDETLARMTSTIEAMSDGFFAIDSSWRLTLVNEALVRAAGRPRAWLLGRTIWEAFPQIATPDSPFFRNYHRAFEQRVTVEFQAFAPVTRRWVNVKASPTPDGGLAVSFRDVTEQKRAEAGEHLLAQLGRSLLALDVEHSLNAAAVVLVPELADVCFFDVLTAEGTVRRLGLTHVDKAEQERLRPGALRNCPRPGADRDPVSRVIRSRLPELVVEVDDAWRMSSADSPEQFAFLESLGLRSRLTIPLLSSDRCVGALTLGLVRGDRRYDEQDLQLSWQVGLRIAQAVENSQLFQTALAASRARQEILAVVSHDLRSPLQTLKLAATMLADPDPGRDERIGKASRVILDCCRSMQRQIEDLIDFSSVLSGRLSTVLAEHEPGSLLAQALRAFASQAEERGIDLRVVPPAGPMPPVLCDVERIMQVFSNLIANCIKALEKGQSIRLEAGQLPGEIAFTVADTGPGIPAEDLGHIFDRYWRGANYKGTGLGLSIVKGIIEAHGGRVWAESTIGEGTRITFTLPHVEGKRPGA